MYVLILCRGFAPTYSDFDACGVGSLEFVKSLCPMLPT
jgi:hypothetical protein